MSRNSVHCAVHHCDTLEHCDTSVYYQYNCLIYIVDNLIISYATIKAGTVTKTRSYKAINSAVVTVCTYVIYQKWSYKSPCDELATCWQCTLLSPRDPMKPHEKG